ncbi:branched-chain amino acid ABC transporter permease (plasmid) [Rhizobium sp. TRM96647]|uniref:branched-chain amino acid ABC transporter permease n=1 Tax=unclassified Rhizobium TaxID=2613769 RepID=UPI0021E8322F|nr:MULTISPECIES: branched-chain amino acid ABC transporter permease [unclassified Rhizobium]MCV3735161.1 branched-chain amino acid ABC transporter permease [Rhizobium sp. TRM96647]MCV3758075.1 branched-chain amino acid ABC transporter permease [Rhizobium sp. TRM96650]
MEGLFLFAVSIITLGAIYAIICLALNLESGVGGLWDLGIVSFFGVGAYTYTLLTAPAAQAHQHYVAGYGLPMWGGFIAAGVAGGLSAWLIGMPSLKLKREYFLITTLAFSEVIRQIYVNEEWLTNGVAGIYGLAQPFKGLVSPAAYNYVLIAVLLVSLAATYLAVRRIVLSPFGRTLKAIRENEALATTAGISARRYNMKVFIVAGTLTAFAGVFYVWYNTLIIPGQFTSDLTFFIWTAVIIGGLGSLRGALIGGFVFIVLHDVLRFIQVSGEMAVALTSLRTALIGVVLVAILRFRPDGILPERPVILDNRSNRGGRDA